MSKIVYDANGERMEADSHNDSTEAAKKKLRELANGGV
jgi:hypothetical protein